MFFLDRTRDRDGSEIHKNKTDANLPIKKGRQRNYKMMIGVDAWDNVYLAVSCENQKRVDERIPLLLEIPAKHKWISLKLFIGEIDLDKYLQTGQIETVLVGRENYEGDPPLHYEWVKQIYEQCIQYHVEFIFEQTGNYFVKGGKTYYIKDHKTQIHQALASGLQNRNIKTNKENTKMIKEEIYEFIARQKTSIISSIGEDSFPATRALIQPVLIDGNDIYFATYTSSRKVVLTDQPTKQHFSQKRCDRSRLLHFEVCGL